MKNITSLKNVGKARAELLNSAGIFTIEELLYTFPRTYKDRTNILAIDEIEGEWVTIHAKVQSIYGTNKFTTIKIKDSTGSMNVMFFGQAYLKKVFELGKEYLFFGRLSLYKNKPMITNPDFEPFSDNLDSILPVYKTKLSQKIFRGLMKQALNIHDFEDEEKNRAFNYIHFPKNMEELKMAHKYFIKEELTRFCHSILELKKERNFIKMQNLNIDLKLPFELTISQKKVIEEIKKDISEKHMNRLIQGDVGSGKTIVAILATNIVKNNGYQTAILAPTEILANQLFNNFKEFFPDAILLTGSTKQKLKIKKQIANGTSIIIGTHAIIQKDVIFKNLALVIIDEQHRFGVEQREALVNKGDCHVLLMSATPIPRSLAMIIYADMDISIINEKPAGRQEIRTDLVNPNYRERIYNFFLKEIRAGRQVYVVCPAIDSDHIESVIEYAKKLEEFFKNEDIKISILHGAMKEEEKFIAMQNFKENEINILVSTTVIEVGVNVPNATIMLIEDAKRFGLSQLHQLRGRVGRGSYQSYCILIGDPKNERLKAIKDSSDGFKISEKDLELRGPGDFFGAAQHGMFNFRIADLYRDIDLLKEIKEEVQRRREKQLQIL